jgi:hypothetical protein
MWLVISAIVAVIFFGAWVLMPVAAKKTPLPKRDENAPCPVCGNARGRLRAVAENANDPKSKVLLQRECLFCGGRCHEKPVVNDLTVEKAWPASAEFRNAVTNVTPLRKKA